MGVETENYEISAKGFENTKCGCIFRRLDNQRSFARVLLKGQVQI